MAMQYLEGELRIGDVSDQAFADIIGGVRKARGSDIPLPETTKETFVRDLMEVADPTIKQVWALKRKGRNDAEISRVIDRSKAHVALVASFLRGMNLIERTESRGRKRGGRNMQRKPNL